jgi:hypothetical protein
MASSDAAMLSSSVGTKSSSVRFTKPLRRVALHPLALAPDDEDPWSEPGGLLRRLMNVSMTVTVVDGQPQSMTTPLPDELQFESLAIRARAFTLERDLLFWKDLDAAGQGVETPPTCEDTSHWFTQISVFGHQSVSTV